MSEFDVKMQLLDLSGGDVDKARVMFAWLNEVTPAVEPAPVEDGIVLTEREVMSNDESGLMALAMSRVAVMQNAPQVKNDAAEEQIKASALNQSQGVSRE